MAVKAESIDSRPTKTRSGRVIKKPDRLITYLAHSSVDKYVKEKRKEEKKIWAIEQVLKVEGDSAHVKWNGDRHNSTVSLSSNPQLLSNLAVNVGNPDSPSEVARETLPSLCSEDKELWLIRHALFDELQYRTRENDTGQVKVPLSKEGFSSLFGKWTFPLATARKLDFSGTRNVRFSCTAAEFGTVIGTEFIARQLPDSSTICEVDPSSKMWISWGYELKVNYDHSACPRCTYISEDGSEEERPRICRPLERKYPPLSFLEISFKRAQTEHALQSWQECNKDYYLSSLHKQLTEVLALKPAEMRRRHEEDQEDPPEDPASTPVYWVSKWVDYSAIYGLGYTLSDNSVGVLFNDHTRLILCEDGDNLQYILRKGQESFYTMKGFPESLHKKVKLLEYFRNYMNDHLLKTGGTCGIKVGESFHLPYLRSWFRTNKGIILHLSNGVLQINFFKDHTKILLCPRMGAVTFIDAQKRFRTFPFKMIGKHGCSKEVSNRVSYAKEIVEDLILKWKDEQSGKECHGHSHHIAAPEKTSRAAGKAH